MKHPKIINIFNWYFLVMVLGLLSCKNDNSLQGTVWIYQSKDKAEIETKALVFGEKSVEYYVLDSNDKVVNFSGSYNYSIEGDYIVIGDSKSNLDSNHIFCFGKYFYKSSKKPGDLCP